MELPKELFDILVCPADRTKVIYTGQKDGLKCSKCGKVYPIKDGIPVFV